MRSVAHSNDNLPKVLDVAVRVGALADGANLIARRLGTQHMAIDALVAEIPKMIGVSGSG